MGKKDNYNYYNEFLKFADYIVESANILNETLKEYSEEKLKENKEKVHKLENDADHTLHDMRNYLIKDFLPPIDREDIILIGHRLDDIEDEIDEILINFDILNIKNVREEALEFSDLLIKASENVKNVLMDFEKFKKFDLIKQKIINISEIEEQGDKLYEKSMSRLFRESTVSIEVLQWSTIFRCFEDAIDACEHIGDCIEDVILKNS